MFKFESVDDDGRRRTDDGPLVYYKFTLWAFGSGELIKVIPIKFSLCQIMQLSVADSVTSGSVEVQLLYNWILDLMVYETC